MPQLPALECPECCGTILSVSFGDPIRTAGRFEDCLRRCESCEIGASNVADPASVTYIYRDPLQNVPEESRAGVDETLKQALNIRNRETKRRRFGFSTSEDAVTWVVFTYLLRSGQLPTALVNAGLLSDGGPLTPPALLLWGAPIDGNERASAIRQQLSSMCLSLREDPNSLSEPDVIVDFGHEGLLFIEVKYRSGNDARPQNYSGWSRYASPDHLTWNYEDVRAAGCYELTRNWCLLKRLAGNRRCYLVNLGAPNLFRGAEGSRLNRFVELLGDDDHSRFVKLTWSDFLRDIVVDSPDWFSKYCRKRHLIS